MKNTQSTKNYLIGIITIFIFIVILVEFYKKLQYNASMTIDQNFDFPYLFLLPLFSIGVLSFMIIPKSQIYRLGYYATTLGLILINIIR
jgi:hypothetical protein